MTFKTVRKAITNGNWGDLNQAELFSAVTRQKENVRQQRDALLACVFGSKRCMRGRGAKILSSDYDATKATPFCGYLDSDRVLNKFETVNKLYEDLIVVEKRLGLVK